MNIDYGFKANSPKDALFANNVIMQADSLKQYDYKTLAEYQINDVQMKPHSLSLGLPRQWMLTLNTTMLGFNKPNRQSVYFTKPHQPGSKDDLTTVGDGYVSYPITADQFVEMVKGGLYTNPKGYMQRLKSSLVDKQFYRETQAHLTEAAVRDDGFNVSAGDFLPHPVKYHKYYIGRDLEAYASFDKDRQYQSNLTQNLNQQLTEISKSPVEPMKQFSDIDDYMIQQADVNMPALDDITLNSEVSINLDQAKMQRLKDLGAQSAMASMEAAQAAQAALDKRVDDVNAENGQSNNDSAAATPKPKLDEVSVADVIDTSSSSVSDSSESSVTESIDVNSSVSPFAQPDDTGLNVGNLDDDDISDLDSMMAELSQDDSDNNNPTRRRRRQHAYVDDFGAALQDSQASQTNNDKEQQQLLKRQKMQRQEQAAEKGNGPEL